MTPPWLAHFPLTDTAPRRHRRPLLKRLGLPLRHPTRQTLPMARLWHAAGL